MSMWQADCTVVHYFTDYVFMDYININSTIFPPEIWVEFSSSISLTINTYENFHAKHVLNYLMVCFIVVSLAVACSQGKRGKRCMAA